MKIPKDASRTARQLIRNVTKSGQVDSNLVRQYVGKIIETKPRKYLAILTAFQRMLRLEVEKRHAVIESSTPLASGELDSVLGSLKAKHGAEMTHETRVNPDLLGGLRVKIGSTVWDGSVRTRLERLRDKLLA